MRDDIFANKIVVIIFAVISTVFETGVKFKQDVKFEVNVVDKKAVCDLLCKHTSCDFA